MTSPNAAIVPTVSPGQRLNVDAVDQQITLANGMTAGYGVNDNHNDNWPVNPTGKLYGNWRLQPNRIGFIRNTTDLGNGIYTLYFMYNPNQININWTTNPAQGSPLYLYGQNLSQQAGAVPTADPASVPSYATAQTVGWDLYFDRTYDMLYGGGASVTGGGSVGRPDYDRGVLKDVAALYNLMGTFIVSDTGSAVPFSTPCEVVFGQNGGGQLWGFTGYISSMQIQFGIFRHDMIPSRAEVSLTLTATYVSNQVNPGGASTSPDTNTIPVPINPVTGLSQGTSVFGGGTDALHP